MGSWLWGLDLGFLGLGFIFQFLGFNGKAFRVVAAVVAVIAVVVAVVAIGV